MLYTYIANIKEENGFYTVEFPAFGIEGRGFADYDETVSFAESFLAEIILGRRREGKSLPPVESVAGAGGAPGEHGEHGEHGVFVRVDPDAYERKNQENAKRVFYEFETDEDVAERNRPAFAGKGRIVGIAAAVIILIAVIIALLYRG